MITLTKTQLLGLLQEIAGHIKTDDSIEGRFEYHFNNRNEQQELLFDVEAVFRVGNSEGQGGSVIL